MNRNAAESGAETPPIPDKLYFRIGEVAKLCAVETYVLRFWESEFPQLKPNKGGTGQRLYRKRDVEMALRIKRLLHDQGYTIAGARQVFAGDGKTRQPELPLAAERPAKPARNDALASGLESKVARMRLELKDLLRMLSNAPATGTHREPRPRRNSDTKNAGPGLFEV